MCAYRLVQVNSCDNYEDIRSIHEYDGPNHFQRLQVLSNDEAIEGKDMGSGRTEWA